MPVQSNTHRAAILCLCLFALCVVLSWPRQALTSSPQQNESVRTLSAGASVERELAGEQTHSYQIPLEAEQYVEITVEQRGCDLTATLLDAAGNQVAESAYVRGLNGQEVISYVTRTAGAHRVAIRLQGKLAGRYVLQVAALRVATAQDAARVNTYRLLMEARGLHSQETADAMRHAVSKFEEALAAWQTLGDQSAEAATLDDAGQLAYDLADAKKALAHWTQALTRWRALGQRTREARTLSNLGLLSYASGSGNPARPQYEEALALHRAEGDVYWEAETLNRLGWLANAREDRPSAIAYHQQALPLRRQVGDRAGEAVTLNDLGRAHSALGNNLQAVEFYQQALALNSPEENPDGLANTYSRLGVSYDAMRESQKALDAHNQALSLLERANNRRTLAQALNNVGYVHANLGDYSRALEYYDRSLKLSRELGMRNGEATTLLNIGIVLRDSGSTQNAIENFNQALTLHQAAKNRGGQAQVLHALGRLYSDTGEHARARELFEQSLALSRAVNDRRNEANALTSLGSTCFLLGEKQKAYEYHSQALPLHKAVANAEGEAIALMGLAQAKHGLGQDKEALALVEQSLQLTESIRAKVPGQELRTTYLALTQKRYETGVALLMQMRQEAAALQANERGRARGLLELLTESGADIRQGVAASLLAQERQLRQRLNARAEAQTRLLNGKYTEAQATAMAQEITAITTQLKDLETEIRRTSPRYAALTQPQPLNAANIQKLLDDDTLLLEYALGEKASYVWAVTSSTLTSYALPPRAEIEKLTRQVYEQLAQRPPRNAPLNARLTQAATTLSRMLLGTASAQLGKKRLVIVAPDILSYLPFAALPYPTANSPFVAAHEIVNLPSASVLAVLREEAANRKPAPQTLAVIADPVFEATDPRVTQTPDAQVIASTALPAHAILSSTRNGLARLAFSRQEAEAIYAITPRGTAMKATDFAASRATVTDAQLGQYRMLHFATHGLLNNQHPELSGLVFSLLNAEGKAQDGFLRLHEVFNLKLNADLVTLSACETALGQAIKGEGLVGLTRGFMYAGTPRVVASLWNVDDLATAELMKHFYEGMLKNKLSPAAALRAAQMTLAKEKRWAAPYYWAGFVLQGEWK